MFLEKPMKDARRSALEGQVTRAERTGSLRKNRELSTFREMQMTGLERHTIRVPP
jgi:hypothetical protein